MEVDAGGNLVIARILAGGMIDRQGLLHVGDAIREVNGVEVHTPEELQTEIARARESVTLRVVPSYELETAVSGQVKPSAALTKAPAGGSHDGSMTLVSPPVHSGTHTPNNSQSWLVM